MSLAMPMIYPLSRTRLIDLPFYKDDNGGLVVVEGLTHVPFNIARVFMVSASSGAVRGQHAHKRCVQFMVCSTGVIEIICDDGIDTATFILDRPSLGLLVPPSLWAQETFQKSDSVLTVFCDRPFEIEDYIRDYADFLAYRKMARDLGIAKGKS
jgi:dTDP-4-dehydrorhamnose 3,5-epimerase-like enzyme